MSKCIHSNYIIKTYLSIANFSNHYLFPLIVLLMRLWIARIFWYSGLTKIASWGSTLYLFKYEYNVPIIPTEIAAYLATAIELSMPWLLVFGFLTRFAAIPLLCMTAVIQLTYLELTEHLYWAFLLSVIIFYGPGKYSIDHFLRARCKTCYNIN